MEWRIKISSKCSGLFIIFSSIINLRRWLRAAKHIHDFLSEQYMVLQRLMIHRDIKLRKKSENSLTEWDSNNIFLRHELEDINKQANKQTKQNKKRFCWFQFYLYKLCIIMCIGIAPLTILLN